MTDIRIRDYENSDAEDLNRIAVSAFDQYRDQYQDWPAMRASLSKTSALSATGEIIVAEFQKQFAGALRISGRTAGKPCSSINAGPLSACWSSILRSEATDWGAP